MEIAGKVEEELISKLLNPGRIFLFFEQYRWIPQQLDLMIYRCEFSTSKTYAFHQTIMILKPSSVLAWTMRYLLYLSHQQGVAVDHGRVKMCICSKIMLWISNLSNSLLPVSDKYQKFNEIPTAGYMNSNNRNSTMGALFCSLVS